MFAFGESESSLQDGLCAGDWRTSEGFSGFQSFGVLFVLNDSCISLCSSNVGQVLGFEIPAILGQPVREVLGNELSQEIEAALPRLIPGEIEELGSFPVAGYEKSFEACFHRTGESLVLELLVPPDRPGPVASGEAVARQLRQMIRDVSTATSLEAGCQFTVDHVRRATGYDQVVIQRFDSYQPTRKLAHSRSEDISSISTLSIAHEQSPSFGTRATGMRIVADVEGEMVSLGARNARERIRPLDLGKCLLRAPTSRMRTLLENNGMRAALEVPILCRGRLWGQITCRHRAPRVPSGSERSQVAAIGEHLSSWVAQFPGEGRGAEARLVPSIPTQLELLLGLFDQGVVLVDAEGIILSWNDGATRILGSSTQEMVGKSLFARYPAELVEQVRQTFTQVRGGEIFAGDWQDIHATGVRVWLTIRAGAFPERHGSGSGVLLLFRDITERKNTENALRASEERLWILENLQTELVCRFLPDTTLTYANEAYFRAFQKSPEELIGRSILELIPERDRESVRSHLRMAANRGVPQILEHEVLGGDGSVRWQQWVNVPLCGPGGEILEFQAVGRDVTDRKRTEDVLRETESRFRVMADDSSLIIWVTDVKGSWIYSNRRWEEFRGASAGTFWDYLHPEDRPRVEKAWLRAHERGDKYSLEFRLLRHDGVYRWMFDTGMPRFSEKGELLGYVGSMLDMTLVKEAEEARQLSEERLRLALQGGQLGIWDWDIVGGHTVWDESSARLFGTTLEEFDGTFQRFARCVLPQDLPLVERAIEQALSRGQDFDLEFRVLWKDGSLHWIAGKASVQYDSVGRAVRLTGTCQDITKRRQAEQRLREAWKMFSQGPAVLVRWETCYPYRLLFVTDSIEQFGYQAEDFLSGQFNWIDMVHPEDRDRTHQEVVRAQQAGVTFLEQSYRIITSSGAVRWVYDYTVPVFDHEGSLLFGDGYVLDVTPLHVATEALRNTNRQYRLLADSIHDVVQVIGPDRIVNYVSPSCERVLGFSPAVLLGKDVLEFIHPEDHGLYLEAMTTSLAGRTNRQEWRSRHTAGHFVTLETVMTPLRNEQGGVEGVVCSSADVTQRKVLEERLRQAQKLEAIGHLAGGVAHDFNNLLTVVNGYALMLLEETGKEHPDAETLRAILEAGQRGASLTQQLLAFGRKQMLKIEILELNDVVVHINKILTRLLGEDIEYVVHLAANLHVIKADRSQLDQILMNLAVNARDAMPNGGKLTIGTRNICLKSPSVEFPEASPGRYVELSIRDTGCGIDESVRAHLFEPFFTTKPVDKGTGLGLATVYGIVKQFEGHIAVESTLGEGTTFRILLPAILEETQTPDFQPAPNPQFKGLETILLVEDDDGVRRLTTRMLERLGYRVLAAADGQSALTEARGAKEPIHLLLSDIVMPGMNGPELATALKHLLPRSKILFLSGYTEDEVFRRGIQTDQVAFLQKPFTSASLGQKVREVLDSK